MIPCTVLIYGSEYKTFIVSTYMISSRKKSNCVFSLCLWSCFIFSSDFKLLLATATFLAKQLWGS